MRVARIAGLSLALVAAGCGTGGHGEKGAGSHGDKETTAAPVPTPDTTPIEALRTPAGLVLKIESPTTPVPATPPPAATPAAK